MLEKQLLIVVVYLWRRQGQRVEATSEGGGWPPDYRYEPVARCTSLIDIHLVVNTCFTVPFERNPRFIGRESLLVDLEAKLFVGEQTTETALVRLSGIGKTQVALELAYRTRARY